MKTRVSLKYFVTGCSHGTIFAKNLLKVSTIRLLSDTTLILSFIFIWKERLNSLPETFIIDNLFLCLGYWKRISFLYEKEIHNNFFVCFSFLFASVLLFKNLFLKWDLVIISLKGAFVKGAWFPRTYRFFSRACSLKIFTIL